MNPNQQCYDQSKRYLKIGQRKLRVILKRSNIPDDLKSRIPETGKNTRAIPLSRCPVGSVWVMENMKEVEKGSRFEELAILVGILEGHNARPVEIG